MKKLGGNQFQIVHSISIAPRTRATCNPGLQMGASFLHPELTTNQCSSAGKNMNYSAQIAVILRVMSKRGFHIHACAQCVPNSLTEGFP